MYRLWALLTLVGGLLASANVADAAWTVGAAMGLVTVVATICLLGIAGIREKLDDIRDRLPPVPKRRIDL